MTTKKFNPELILKLMYNCSDMDVMNCKFVDKNGNAVTMGDATHYSYTEIWNYDEDGVAEHTNTINIEFDYDSFVTYLDKYYSSVSPFGKRDGRFLCETFNVVLEEERDFGSVGDVLKGVRNGGEWDFNVNPYAKYDADAYLYEDSKKEYSGALYVTTNEVPQDWEV